MSSVRLTIADGGKSEVGTLKERMAGHPFVRPVRASGAPAEGGEDEEERAEKRVKMMGRQMTASRNRRRRGGRIL